MKKIKFATIITRLVGGGAQYIVLQINSILSEERFEKYFVCGSAASGAEGDYFNLAKKYNINPVLIPELVRDVSPIKDIVALCKIYFFLKKNRIDFVYTATSKAGVLGRIAAKLAGVKIIVHSPLGHIFAKNSNIKGVEGYPLRKRIFLIIERIAAHFCDIIIACSEKEKNEELALGIGESEQYRVINLSIDYENFIANLLPAEKIRQELNLTDKEIVIGIVGRLSPEKGHSILFQAIAKLKERGYNISLIVLGDGELRNELEKQILKLNLQNSIKIVGLRENVASYLQVFDIFVLSSTSEGFPLVLLEAMFIGKPVVTTNVGGVCEIVLNNKTGIIVEPNSTDELVRGLEILIIDKDKREEFGKHARKIAFAKYTKETMKNNFITLFNELIAQRFYE